MKESYSFIGDYQGRFDTKNRVVLPSAFKREIEGGADAPQSTGPNTSPNTSLVLKKDIYEKCLLLYPRSVWDALMADLRQRIDPYNRRHAQFLREFQKNTMEAQLDANGRLLVPQRLLDLIGASKEVSFLGVDDHIELWDAETYSADTLSEDQFGELADALFGKKDI